jgi:hypothetical protein
MNAVIDRRLATEAMVDVPSFRLLLRHASNYQKRYGYKKHRPEATMRKPGPVPKQAP